MNNTNTSNRKIWLWAGSVLLASFVCIWLLWCPHGDRGGAKAAEAKFLHDLDVYKGASLLGAELLAGRVRLSDELMKSAKPTSIHEVYWLRENPDFRLWQLASVLNKHELASFLSNDHIAGRPPENDKIAALRVFSHIVSRPVGSRSYGWEDDEYFYFSIGLPDDRGNLVRGLMIEKKTGADYAWGESIIKRVMEKEAARTALKEVNPTGQP